MGLRRVDGARSGIREWERGTSKWYSEYPDHTGQWQYLAPEYLLGRREVSKWAAICQNYGGRALDHKRGRSQSPTRPLTESCKA
jgi:hypothetical protein